MDAKNWYKRGKLPAKLMSVPIERLMIEESAPVPERMRVGNPNFGRKAGDVEENKSERKGIQFNCW